MGAFLDVYGQSELNKDEPDQIGSKTESVNVFKSQTRKAQVFMDSLLNSPALQEGSTQHFIRYSIKGTEEHYQTSSKGSSYPAIKPR